MSKQSAHEGGKVVGPKRRPPNRKELPLLVISVWSCLPQGHNAFGMIN
jgi:hypothetical protein